MSSFQKVIKYFAIAFAALIIFNIVTGIIYGFNMLSSFFSESELAEDRVKEVEIKDSYTVLDIEVTNADIIIKDGSEFKIEKDSDNVKVKEVGNKLLITEKNYSLFEKKTAGELIIYVPSDLVFDEVSIENGAGRVDVDSLRVRELELDLGAGKVVLNELEVSSEMSIDGGAGEVVVSDGNINNLDLDMGIGRVELNLSLTGNSEINAGVGEVLLNLLGSSDRYKINVNKGVGTIMVDGNKMGDNSSYGTGSNVINIDGGIGEITVNFEK